MQPLRPLRIRIDRIVDFGAVVSLVGTDTETAAAITVHVDHRPFAKFRQAWIEAGSPLPLEYGSDRLMLHLDMLPDGMEQPQLAEDGAPAATAATQAGCAVQEPGR